MTETTKSGSRAGKMPRFSESPGVVWCMADDRTKPWCSRNVTQLHLVESKHGVESQHRAWWPAWRAQWCWVLNYSLWTTFSWFLWSRWERAVWRAREMALSVDPFGLSANWSGSRNSGKGVINILTNHTMHLLMVEVRVPAQYLWSY